MTGTIPAAEPPDALHDLAILVADDDPGELDVLERLLARAGYQDVQSTREPGEALRLLRSRSRDLILLDLHMPGMDGFQVMKSVREHVPPGTYLPILVVTGDLEVRTRQRALSAGATDFVTKPYEATEVLLRIQNLLETRHLHLRLRRHSEALEERVRERTRELEEAQGEILARLALAAEYRDDVTGKHAQRVGEISGLLAVELGLDGELAELIRRAAPLHDVGKIGVPDAILLKPASLTPSEREVIQRHVAIGARILGGSRFAVLQLAAEIALHHHERWDGGGYRGLAGTDIPVAGRIVAVADVFDSLMHERPYKRALSLPEALELIVSERGSQFDPEVVDAFMRLLEGGTLRRGGLVPDEPPSEVQVPGDDRALPEPPGPPGARS